MKYIEVITNEEAADTVVGIAGHCNVNDIRMYRAVEAEHQQIRILVSDDKLQSLLDKLEGALGKQSDARVTVLAVESYLPRSSHTQRKEEKKAIAARDALYNEVERNSHFDRNFVLLVVLSTLVAAIGLVEDNVAVIIGAMVIAPLLGPNLAFGLGTTLGDWVLMYKSALTIFIGVVIAISLSYVMGFFWPEQPQSHELLSRTEAGLDSVALALASGAAAALSLSTGLSSVLVGVMVAVALLPPAATVGIMLGYGETDLAKGALILLGINIASVNLACNLVFFFKGISPRTWREKAKAKRASFIYAAVWSLTLLILILVVYTKPVVVNT